MPPTEACSSWPHTRLIVLVGPTATGKTAAAVELAERIDGEIINADSMQVYIGLDVGTAKPDVEQRQRIPFHLLDLVTPDQPFSVADWKTRAENALKDITARGKRPILCGGTGLYIRALIEDWSLAETPADPQIRRSLQEERNRLGTAALHEQLRKIDPQTAARLHPNDGVRIERALEVYLVTGQPMSTWLAQDQLRRRPRAAIRLGLTLPRDELYARINTRVEEMLHSGWEAEVRALLRQGYAPTLSPMKSLGYKELSAYIRGEIDYITTVEAIKQNTRRFAKRQQTWFRADTRIDWLDVSAMSSATVAQELVRRITNGAAADPAPEQPDGHLFIP